MSKYLIAKNDCDILRDHPDFKGMAVLITCYGDILLKVPADEWTNRQIETALNMANQFFDSGFRAGEQSKENQIKKALNIKF